MMESMQQRSQEPASIETIFKHIDFQNQTYSTPAFENPIKIEEMLIFFYELLALPHDHPQRPSMALLEELYLTKFIAEGSIPVWRDAKKDTPPVAVPLLLWYGENRFIGHYAGGEWFVNDKGFYDYEKFTHWMPLPAPPTKEEV